MKSENFFRLAAAVAALHVAVLSMVFGPRHVGYMLAAALSATLTWGVMFFHKGRKRRAGLLLSLALCVAVQQIAYQVWKLQLPGFWWPLAQFAALQVLIALGIGQATRQAT